MNLFKKRYTYILKRLSDRTMQTNKQRSKLLTVIFPFLLLWLLNFYTLSAQEISFKKLGLEEGLSELAGLCIHQDHLNRMWIGTRNGLNCWDGIRMKTFYPQRGDSTSLAGHKVSELHQTDHYLWAQSGNHLSRLDLHTLSFKRYSFNGLLTCGNFNTTILVATRGGLLIYDKNSEKFIPYKLEKQPLPAFNAIYQDRNKVLWLASNNESKLIKVTADKKEIIDVPVSDKFIVYDLFVDSENKLWISTRYHGIFVYDINTGVFSNVNLNTAPYFVESLSVRKVIEDKNNRLWVGTFKGLAVFDRTAQSTTFIRSGSGEYGLTHNSVYSLFLSNDDNIWVGSYFGGINYGRVANQVFTRYNNQTTGGPSYPVIGAMVEDNNNIWIATEGGGLDYYNRADNTFTNYPFTNDKYGLSQTNIKSLYLTLDNKLLIGTYQGGLNIFDLKQKTFKHYNKPGFKDRPYHVNDIIEYNGRYILATEIGVISFDIQNEEFKPFIQTSENLWPAETIATDLYIDTKGILWISTAGNGLFAYNLSAKTLKKYLSNEFDPQSIGSNSVNQIIEDHRFRLWLGTDGGGLCLYNRETDNFTSFTQQKNNLPSDFIYGISESRFGNLWIATSRGLSRFDVENQLFFNYTSASGFPLQELNYKGLLLTKSGELFLGGIDGLVSFKERDLLMVDENLEVNFSGLYVNNKEVRANDNTGILSTDIAVAESFVLKPTHTVFSIDFSSFNYNNTLNNKYQYQLEGFNNEWVNAEYNTSVTYTNLNPGKYVFKIRATDVAYNPITNEKAIAITIKPPLTRTWYAYTFYVLLLAALILLFNYFYLGKVRLQYQLKNERSEKERMKELNQYKLRFFTNISHEFMTPLTIILSSLEHAFAKYKIPPKIHWHLNLALRNAKRLKNLNSELLDFRKIEQGHLKIEAQENDLVPYLNEIYEAFKEIAHHKNISYEAIIPNEKIMVFYDARQMDKVFYNLLSNALNHVENSTGKVQIKLEHNAEAVEIEVKDNGVGIPGEDLDKVFNRFFHHDSKYQQNAYQGSGIGLALTQSIVQAHRGQITCESELNSGTSFKVKLVKGNQHLDADEISQKKRSNAFSIDKELIAVSQTEERNETVALPAVNENAPQLLIVDDNPEIRIAVKNLFVENYQITTANDGAEGLAIALENQPDIIISDVLMPNMSGFEMCKKLKNNLNTSHIPVLLLTALDSEEDRTKAFKHGADSYCTKPFNSEMLQARVNNLFENRAKLQQKFSTDPAASTKSITQNKVDSDFLLKTTTIVENNLLNPDFNVDEFATEMNMGRTIFYSKVKMITGQTPNEYIQTIRLKKAADMLVNDTSKNISEVAYDTGFNSPRYFAMAFKKHFGVNPSQYVKR